MSKSKRLKESEQSTSEKNLSERRRIHFNSDVTSDASNSTRSVKKSLATEVKKRNDGESSHKSSCDESDEMNDDVQLSMPIHETISSTCNRVNSDLKVSTHAECAFI